MFQIAGELLPKFGASFVISGEVLGQRPMSQNIKALGKVEKLSGMGDLIVRPLCGKLLPITKPVAEGWIDENGLLDIQGRNRSRQIALMKQYGIENYPTPGGGCLLTDPSYSKRLRILAEDGYLEKEYDQLYSLLKQTRFFRLEKGKYLFVGRDDPTNQILEKMLTNGNLQFVPISVPGPRIMAFGKLTSEQEIFAMELFSRYSKIKGNDLVELELLETDGKEIFRREKRILEKIDHKKIENQMNCYQVL
jgi:tRNA-specific 2-thiouridylase